MATEKRGRDFIISKLSSSFPSFRISEVFDDWIEITAIAFSNAVDKIQFERREAQYFNIIKKYSKEELNTLVSLLPELINEYERSGFDDVLGQLYMGLDMGNSRMGQFFTPYSVSKLSAQVLLDGEDLDSRIQEKGFFSVSEPTCGSGGMVIAMADEVKSMKVNYQQHMYVVAQDLDRRCVHMTYIQMTLFNIPGVVIRGNTLKVEELERWYTPAYILGGWAHKLRRTERIRDNSEVILEPYHEPEKVLEILPPQIAEPLHQMALF